MSLQNQEKKFKISHFEGAFSTPAARINSKPITQGSESELTPYLPFGDVIAEKFGLDIRKYWKISTLTTDAFRSKYYRREVCDHDRKNPLTGFRGDVAARHLAVTASTSSRAEGFIRGTLFEPVELWDVDSMHPACARLLALPCRTTKWRNLLDVPLNELSGKVGFARVHFEFPKDTIYPSLPVTVVRRSGDPVTAYTLEGETTVTLDDVRGALKLGAEVKILDGRFFEPGPEEIQHDLRAYFEVLMPLKASALPKSLERELWKSMLNQTVGCLVYRDKRGGKFVGSIWNPEAYSLILGKSRQIMSELCQAGQAIYAYNDSVVVRKGTDIQCAAIDELGSVASGLKLEVRGTGIFVSRPAMYAVFDGSRPHIVLTAKFSKRQHRDLAEDIDESVRAALIEKEEEEYRRLVEISINKGRSQLPQKELRSSGHRRSKRSLDNLFTQNCPTLPYLDAEQARQGDEQKHSDGGAAFRKRVLSLIQAGWSVKQIEEETGGSKSAIYRIRSKAKPARQLSSS